MDVEANISPLSAEATILVVDLLGSRCCLPGNTIPEVAHGGTDSRLSKMRKCSSYPSSDSTCRASEHTAPIDDWNTGSKDSQSGVKIYFQRTLSDIRHGSTIYYTDGSHAPITEHDALAVVCCETKQYASHRLPNEFSDLSAELAAIRHAMQLTLVSGTRNLITATDNASSISTIRAQRHPYGQDILTISQELNSVTIIWCPSHVGVVRNEKADALAKRAFSDDDTLPPAWSTLDLRRLVKQQEQKRLDFSLDLRNSREIYF